MNERSNSLLNAAREGLAPDAAAAARVRARIAAAVGAAAPAAMMATSAPAATAPAATAPAATAAATTAAKASLVLKLGALLVVAGGIAIGVHHRAATVDAPQVTPAVAHDELTEPAITTATHEPPARAAAPHARTLEPASLSREVELIDQAMLAMRAHDPDGALTVLRTFDRETHGHAQMAEEAAAISIEARCALDEDVGERLAAFDRAWPESAERSRITDACR